MRKTVLIILLCVMLLALNACSKKEDSGSTEPVEKDVVSTTARAEALTKVTSEEVAISVLERVYEGVTGVRVTSRHRFTDTINNSTTFEITHASPKDKLVVNINLTEFQQVDFKRLSESRSLYTEHIVPSNVRRWDEDFVVDENVILFHYTTGSIDKPLFVTIALINDGKNVYKIYTSSGLEHYTEVIYTFQKEDPKPAQEYKLIVSEIARVEVIDIAFNAPMATSESALIEDEIRKVRVETPDNENTYIEAFVIEEPTESDYPTIDNILAELGEGWKFVATAKCDHEEHDNCRYDDHLFSFEDNWAYRIAWLESDGRLYIVAARGEPMLQYVGTLRMALDDDIYTQRSVYEDFESTGSGESVMGQDVNFWYFTANVPTIDNITQKPTMWRYETRVDDYVEVFPSRTELTTASIRNVDDRVQKTTRDGNFFVGTHSDGTVYMFRQLDVDGMLYTVKATGTTGIAIARSLKPLSTYITFQDRGWERTVESNITFWAPKDTTRVVENDSSFGYFFPNGDRLLFKHLEKKLTDEQLKAYTKLEKDFYKVIRADDDTFAIHTRVGQKEYEIISSGRNAREALFSMLISR